MTFQVIQLHGGTIDFTSEAGVGTEFRLKIPAASQPAAPRSQTGATRKVQEAAE
jgi:signal transduction histidine kinase